MPSRASWLEFNFSTTYYLEIVKKPNTKLYESEWFINDFNHHFKRLSLTDAQLNGLDVDDPIEFNLISRNQFKMEDELVCSLALTTEEIKDIE